MKKTLLALVLVLTMVACMPVGGGITSYASDSASQASSSETAPSEPCAAEENNTDAVYNAACDYFANLPSDINALRADALFEMMDAGDNMLILDIRSADDYAAGHLIGAVNLSFLDMSIPENLGNLPDDKLIMVNCYSGQSASKAVVLLNLAGKMARNVQSGFNDGIRQTDNYESYIETAPHDLDAGTYAVDACMAGAIRDCFAAKMEKDGTIFAHFNIAPDDVNNILDDDSFLLLSVRQASDYNEAHIPGAINIPFGQGMEKGLTELPTEKIIIVYCYSGQSASQTTAALRMMGYDAYSLSGGFGNAEAGTGWLGGGFATESGAN